MPKIFSKDAQINVVEYGEHACMTRDVQNMKAAVMAFFKGLFSK